MLMRRSVKYTYEPVSGNPIRFVIKKATIKLGTQQSQATMVYAVMKSPKIFVKTGNHSLKVTPAKQAA